MAQAFTKGISILDFQRVKFLVVPVTMSFCLLVLLVRNRSCLLPLSIVFYFNKVSYLGCAWSRGVCMVLIASVL